MTKYHHLMERLFRTNEDNICHFDKLNVYRAFINTKSKRDSGGQPAACMRRGLISGEGGNLYAISDAKPSQPFSRPEAAHLVWLTLPPSWKRAM